MLTLYATPSVKGSDRVIPSAWSYKCIYQPWSVMTGWMVTDTHGQGERDLKRFEDGTRGWRSSSHSSGIARDHRHIFDHNRQNEYHNSSAHRKRAGMANRDPFTDERRKGRDRQGGQRTPLASTSVQF